MPQDTFSFGDSPPEAMPTEVEDGIQSPTQEASVGRVVVETTILPTPGTPPTRRQALLAHGLEQVKQQLAGKDRPAATMLTSSLQRRNWDGQIAS